MNVNSPENEKDTDSINRNPAVWQSSGVAYGFLRAIAIPNQDGYQVFAGLGLGTLPDYYKIIKAETMEEAISVIQSWDKKCTTKSWRANSETLASLLQSHQRLHE